VWESATKEGKNGVVIIRDIESRLVIEEIKKERDI
jgi:hypothetical protein